MNIGDIHSTERGSGARFNTGKPPMDLVPIGVMTDAMRHWHYMDVHRSIPFCVLDLLAEFQRGDTNAVLMALGVVPVEAWRDCAQVFDYGRAKYAAWNWAKGMAWSVPLACAVRHALAMLEGEEIDPESKLPHRGHLMCNLVMLATFVRTYPEGDDRPVEWLGYFPNQATPKP